eukprot:TRINITY_DN44995_c0_g1_i1.p1 TRINITY_DN44995_c0_g1~~TRINITY_DN44995_c0_g1_i1.p1  ORF type:complete len:665 (-),score=79.68 TRINITY_DN44995_c0_g1_i1:128-2098(-)
MATVSPAPSGLRLLREMDMFRKLPPEHQNGETSCTTGTVGLLLRGLGLVLVGLLSISECWSYAQPARKQRFDIDMHGMFDAGAPRKMRVNLNVTIHDFPCIDLSLDYQDVMGNRAMDVRSTVFKERLRADGSPVGEVIKNDPKVAVNGGVSNPSILRNSSTNVTCGDCYGALPVGECCNTCSDVLYAYRLKRWALPRIESIAQCRHDGSARSAYQPPQIIRLDEYSSDDYMKNFKTIGIMTARGGSGMEARHTAPLKLNLSLYNITFKPLHLKPLSSDHYWDDWDDDYDDYDYDDFWSTAPRTNKDKKQKPVSWPSCVRRNVVVNGFDIGEALLTDLTPHGAKEGCWKDNCSHTDKFDCESMHHCATVCGEVEKCQWWTWGLEEFAAKCWLRKGKHGKTKRYGFSSGSRNCTPAASTTTSVETATTTTASATEVNGAPRRLSALDDDFYGSRLFEMPLGAPLHMSMFGRGSTESEMRKQQKGESCRIHGYFDVNRVPGNFHIGTHGTAAPSYLSFYDEPSPPQQNMRHTINFLSFVDVSQGQLLNNTQPLDGFESPRAFTFQYYLTISPATDRRKDGTALHGYQFRASSFVTNELIGPAVFFRMEMDPIRVTYYTEEVRFSKFIVSICAVVGGCIAIFSMLEQSLETGTAILQNTD